MRDLETRADIDALMIAFYEHAMSDPLIGYIFTDVAKLDLDEHLPIIGDFWDSVIFGAGKYQKHGRHPMVVHGELHSKSPLLPEHFDRWLEIFNEKVNEMFAGVNAESIKMRANMIAERMLYYVSTMESVGAMPKEMPVKIQTHPE